MLQPSKMQGEARNCRKKHLGALRARLCALRAQDQLENLTKCSLLIATHSDFYASTLKNARRSQKLRKEAFWRASRAIVRAERTGGKKNNVIAGVLPRRTFGPNFVGLRLFLLPIHYKQTHERR